MTSNGYHRPRVYAAAVLTVVVSMQLLAEILVPTYDLSEATLTIELLAILGLLGLEAVDVLRGR